LTVAPTRFRYEFWFICLLVSLGLFESIPIGFYQFRLSDLILDLSLVYCVGLVVKGRFSFLLKVLLAAYVLIFGLRVATEADSVSDLGAMRTLFGMGAIFLTPFIFLAVRESRISGVILRILLITSCAVSFLSQLGVLARGESYAAGYIDLAPLLGIYRSSLASLDYQETTITIWRALSVGLTIAMLASRCGASMKVCGLAGALLQFGGGGGGRSPLIFLSLGVLAVLIPARSHFNAGLSRKVVLAGVLSLGLATLYLWAPAGSGPVKGSYRITHYERATEIFTLFTRGWTAADEAGGFNARTRGYEEYWEGILSSERVFWLGVGLARGAAFGNTPNVLAHNMVLDVWALSGLVGLVFFICYLALVVSDLRALLSVTPDRGEGQLIGLALATAVIYMFQWLLFQAATADRSFMIVFYLLAGLVRPTARLLTPNTTAEHSLTVEAVAQDNRLRRCAVDEMPPVGVRYAEQR
jgi:hypothetical protein